MRCAGGCLADGYQEVNPDLRILGIGITNRCNLACDFCSRSSGPYDSTDLPFEKIQEIVEDAVAISNCRPSISLTGGEPILHPDFQKIVRYVVQQPVTLSVNSNGLLLDRNIVEFCLDVGVDNFAVSLEGPEVVYENTYGSPINFKKICKNLAAIRHLGGRFTLGCTVVPENIHHLEEVVEIARTLGAEGISISRVYPIGRGLQNIDQLFVGWSIFKQAVNAILKYGSPDFFVAVEDNAVRHLFDPGYNEARKHDELSKNGGWNGCFAGVILSQIEANGLVLPCAFMSLPAGDIYQNRFAEIWHNSQLMRDMRRRDLLTGVCGTCSEKVACGGCRARAYALKGDYFAEDPFCPLTAEGAERINAGDSPAQSYFKNIPIKQ